MASKQQRESERRRLQRQADRRRQAAERRKRVNIIISIVGVLVVVGGVIALLVTTNGDDSDDAASEPTPAKTSSSAPASSSASSSAKAAAYPCSWKPSGQAAKKATAPTSTTPPKTGTATVQVATSRGPLTFALDRAKAPCAVASFVSLVQQKYFDSTPCHRLTTGGLSVLQCGDPSGSGSGGPGYSFADEVSGKEQYTRGVLAMANSGPNTNGSQFFIVYKNSQLPPSYTVFGQVTKGLNVVDAVAAKGATGGSGDGAPALPITLTKLTVG